MTQGQRLSELLELKFKRQEDAATYFGVKQPAISIWKSKDELSSRWYKVYGKMLEKVGLNADYIRTGEGAKFIGNEVDSETINAHIESLQREIKRLRLAQQALAQDQYLNKTAC